MTHHYPRPRDALRRIDGWHSPSLGQDMPIVSYGDRGPAMLLFPTAPADFLENERFYLVKSVEPFIQQGRLRLFSIDSINRQAWMDRTLPVAEQAHRRPSSGFSWKWSVYCMRMRNLFIPISRSEYAENGRQ